MKHQLLNRRTAVVAATTCALSLALVGELAARTYQKVVVEGAEFISQESITASCEVEAGVEYSAADLRYMRDCLMSSGQFHSVTVMGEGETLRVVVDEINDRPGRVEAGLAYDSRDGLMGSLYFERYNLFPKTFGAMELTVAKEVRTFETHLYRPSSFGPFDLGVDMLLRQTDYDDQGYTATRTQIEPYLAYGFDKETRLEIGLGYRRDEMTDVSPSASLLFRDEAGIVDAPFLRFGLRYSSLPEAQGALTGVSVAVDQYFWGLGDDQRTNETRVELDARYALNENTSMLFGLQGGVVSAKGDRSTRGVDRFFVGGADFRGFAPRGIGPKDGDQFVGANKYYVASVEVQRELDSFLGTTGRVGLFADVGSAWGLDVTAGSRGAVDDSRQIRSSVGLSLTVDVGAVPVSLYLAKPTDKRPGDDTQTFGVSFKTAF